MTSNNNNNNRGTILGGLDCTDVAAAVNFGGRGDAAKWATVLPVDILPMVAEHDLTMTVVLSRGAKVQIVTGVLPVFDGSPIGTMWRDGEPVEVVALATDVADMPTVHYAKTAPKGESNGTESASVADLLAALKSAGAKPTTSRGKSTRKAPAKSTAKSTAAKAPAIPKGTDVGKLLDALK